MRVAEAAAAATAAATAAAAAAAAAATATAAAAAAAAAYSGVFDFCALQRQNNRRREECSPDREHSIPEPLSVLQHHHP